MSAIVPLYETERYIARCLDSLLAQDLASPDLEIIVIDDGSTDGGGTVAERYAAAHSNISVSRQPNQGLSATRNLGLELARGRYVAFVDSDDHLAPHALGELVALAQRERLDAVAFEYARPWLDEEIPDPPTIVPAEVRVSSGMAHFAEHPYLTPAWAYVWRRGLLDDVGVRFEVGRILEDLVFTTTAIAAADRVAYVPTKVYRYVQRPGSILERRSAADTLRFAADGERAITAMEALRRARERDGSAPRAFLDKLGASEERVVFWIIGRCVRSDVPLRPVLWRALGRLRRLGVYPMHRFPTGEQRSLQNRILTAIFNRPVALLAFAIAVRTTQRLSALAHRSGRSLGRTGALLAAYWTGVERT